MARLRFPGNVDHTLDSKQATTLGSGADSVIRVEDPKVSGVHCVIRALQGGGFGLKDLGSDSGTYVDGKRIEAVRLTHGSKVRIGSVEFEYQDAVPAPPSEPRRAKASPASSPASAHAHADVDFKPGDRLGGYEIEAVLGHGGMGTVYAATQLSLGRKVAIKVLKLALAEDPDFVAGFVSEARAAGRFNHPNVVQVFDVDEEEGRPFYSMELLPDGSLEDRLKARGPLPIDDALRALRDAAAGLEYADELGLVHRDIKPDNLMPSAQGRLKICDLGLATDPGGARQGKILGTPHFLSPEQARGQPVDHRSDVYSLGCSSYRLLCGKNPFPRKTVREILKAHLDAPAPSVRAQRTDCPETLDALIQRMMAKDPAARPHAREIVAEIDALLEGARPSRGPLLAIVGVLVLVVVGGLIFILSRDDKPITIVKDDPAAKQALAANKENKAEIARLQISDALPLLERAQALEKVAKEHPGTKAAGLATKEAGDLRARDAAEKAERAAAAQRLAARVKRVDDLGARAATDPVSAWKELERLSGAAEPGSAFRKAIDAAKETVENVWNERARSAYERFEQAAKAQDSDTAAVLVQLEKDLAIPSDGVPAALPEMMAARLQAGRAFVAELERSRKAERRARIGELVKARDQQIFGERGVLALFRAGRLEEASTMLASVAKAPEGLAELDAPIAKLRDLLSASRAALTALDARARAESIPVTLRGAEVRVLGARGASLEVEGPDDKKFEIMLPDEPAVAAQLLEKPVAARAGLARNGEARQRAALFLLIALADAAPAARNYLAAQGDSTAKPAFPHAMQEGLSALAELPADDPYRKEAVGLAALGKMMRAIELKSEVAARYWSERLEQAAADSLIGEALGVDGGS